jgi:hypothetical protein
MDVGGLKASARVIAGRMVVSRRASIDVPAPGGPRRSTLWAERLYQLLHRIRHTKGGVGWLNAQSIAMHSHRSPCAGRPLIITNPLIMPLKSRLAIHQDVSALRTRSDRGGYYL